MTASEATSDTSTTGAGVYLAILQLVFTLGWTTYVIYLPKLCADVGIDPAYVILILMLDQAIFTVADTAMGIAADRIAPFVGKLGVFVGALTAISCAAFIALPFVAGTGPGAQVWFIGLALIWVVTSSALRAPPLTLLGKYAARPAIPFLAALAMLGYGLAGAVSPYLGVVLRNHDPRLPFVISGVVLLVTTLALSRVERGLAQAPVVAKKPIAPAKSLGQVPMFFIASMVILALGYQLHFSHQQHAVLSALREAGRPAMADAGVLDRLQHRDVSGKRHRQASRRADRDGRRWSARRACRARRGDGRQPEHADRGAVRRGCRVGLHADGCGFGGAGDRRDRRGGQGGRAWCSPRWRLRPLRGWRPSPAACSGCRSMRRCCNGRQSRAGWSPVWACW